jgi:hypothetical protein
VSSAVHSDQYVAVTNELRAGVMKTEHQARINVYIYNNAHLELLAKGQSAKVHNIQRHHIACTKDLCDLDFVRQYSANVL